MVPAGGAIPPATLIVPRRNNGPIIQLDRGAGTALSVQYTGFSATRELDTFLIWDDARNLDDFRRGLEFFDVGGQNWAYTDVEGNIAYFTSAELPLREDLQAGTVNGLPPFFIRNGTGGNEWLPARNPQPGQAIPYEILPYEEMPQTVNPPAGFFVNANNDPAGVTLDNDPLNQTRPGGGIFYLNPATTASAAAASPPCSGPSWPATARCRSPTCSASRPTPPWSTPSSSSPTWSRRWPGARWTATRPCAAWPATGPWPRPSAAWPCGTGAPRPASPRATTPPTSTASASPRPASSRPPAPPPPSTRSGAASSSRAPSTPAWPPSASRCPTASGP